MRDDPAPPFVVGLVAEAGLDAPGLVDLLDGRLLRLTARRRHQVIVLCSVMNEPLSVAAGEVCKRHGWLEQWRAPDPDAARRAGVVRECVGIAAAADALVVVAGGAEVPELAKRLVWLCGWLGTPCRVVRLGAAGVAGRRGG